MTNWKKYKFSDFVDINPKVNLKKGLENTLNWYFENMKYYTTLKKRDITKRLGIIK